MKFVCAAEIVDSQSAHRLILLIHTFSIMKLVTIEGNTETWNFFLKWKKNIQNICFLIDLSVSNGVWIEKLWSTHNGNWFLS